MVSRLIDMPGSTHLEDATLVVVASPAYLKRAGTPRKLTELEQHECIQFDLPSSGRRIPWLFKEDAQTVLLKALEAAARPPNAKRGK
jgi:DNA-binding transcriptional LysR family regulator